MRLVQCLLFAAAGLFSIGVTAQPKPSFLFEPMLDVYFDDSSGLIVFHGSGYDLAFPPDEPLNAVIAVVDDSNTVVESFPFRSEYTNTNSNGSIARAQLSGTAEITLTDPGVYNIVWMIDGQPASRLPVALERLEIGDDPFEQETVYRYIGLWQLYANITNETYQGENWPVLTFWAGHRDFDQPANKLPFFVQMARNGEIVAHSKRQQGTIPYRHYERVKSSLYHPHETRDAANARPFLESDWTQDGDYEIRVTRGSDQAVIRSFHFSARNGEIQPLPETQSGHEPAIDYRAPRVRDKASSGYDFVEAIWIKSRS